MRKLCGRGLTKQRINLMTIKELKQNILLSLYHRYKGGKSTNIGLKDLCEHDHILFDSLQQVSDAAKGLKESGYINFILFIGGDGYISGLTLLELNMPKKIFYPWMIR